MKKMLCFVGPSGVGKSSIIEILSDVPQVWSHTTRPLRSDSDKRFSISNTEFAKRLQQGDFAQAIQYRDHYYGLTTDSIVTQFKTSDVLSVDCVEQGLRQLKSAGIVPEPNVLGIFTVVDAHTLFERLMRRQEPIDSIRYRLQQAHKEVLRFDRNRSLYDLVIVNRNLEKSAEKVSRLICGTAESDPFDVEQFLKDITEILANL